MNKNLGPKHYSGIIQQPKYHSVRVGDKTLISRAAGQFFTHRMIAEHLVSPLVGLLPSAKIRVIDPFAGDGRLLVALLAALSQHGWSKTLEIFIWERDRDAIKLARRNIHLCALDCKIPIDLRSSVCDTFRVAPRFAATFDLVITNPPWEILRPDRRELVHLTERDRDLYISSLRCEDEFMARMYPLSQPSRKFSGWGTNLSRVGTEAAMLLTKNAGICAIVSPLSLFADQVSENLRKKILSDYQLTDLAYFPAEGRFFPKVDQPSVTFVAVKRKPHYLRPVVSVFDSSGELNEKRRVTVSKRLLKTNGYSLPLQLGSRGFEILSAFRGLPRLVDLESSTESLWAGRELDETARASFLSKKGNHPFVKGRMIERFAITEEPKFFISKRGPKIPLSALHSRIAWRDVSRPSQARRMQATLIPPNWVTGNSLNVAFFRNDDVIRLKALLGVMNSIAFEIQVRALLATAHVSLGAVRRVHIPDFTDRNLLLSLSGWVDKCLGQDIEAKIDFEIAVAKAYGLAKTHFRQFLAFFPRLTEFLAIRLMNSPVWDATL